MNDHGKVLALLVLAIVVIYLIILTFFIGALLINPNAALATLGVAILAPIPNEMRLYIESEGLIEKSGWWAKK